MYREQRPALLKTKYILKEWAVMCHMSPSPRSAVTAFPNSWTLSCLRPTSQNLRQTLLFPVREQLLKLMWTRAKEHARPLSSAKGKMKEGRMFSRGEQTGPPTH